MVMKRNMMRKNLYQSIRRSLGRYLAIVAIIALGASMFVGLLMTKSDMVATGQKYMDDQNMFDLRLVSTVGWDEDHVSQISQMAGVVDAEGLFYQDLVVRVGDRDDAVHRFYSMPETVNRLDLRGGRMPQSPDECLIDGYHADDSILGTTVTVSQENGADALDTMVYRNYTVVGYVATPLYMDMNRGTTTVGSGSLTGYFFLPQEGFDADYYTEIHVTMEGDYEIYTAEYNQAMEACAEVLKPRLEPLVAHRRDTVLREAEEAYADGLARYEDGIREYYAGKYQAQRELSEGLKQLEEAQQQIINGQNQLASGEAQIAEGLSTLRQTEQLLELGRGAFDLSKQAAYAPIDLLEAQYQNSLASAAGKLQRLDEEIAALDSQMEEMGTGLQELNDLNTRLAELDLTIPGLESAIRSTQRALDAAQQFPSVNADLIDNLESTLAELNDRHGTAVAERDELIPRRDALAEKLQPAMDAYLDLQSKRNELAAQRYGAELEFQALQAQLDELADSRAALDDQFSAREAELKAAEDQIEAGYEQLSQAQAQLSAAREALEAGKTELESGWQEYENGKLEASRKLFDGARQLVDARLELSDARKAIDKMTGDVFLLDRSSNIGYNSLDSSSDIVQGVSRVFPAFFLLVAALVCITTMTRMIDEERTQIGTLKALGYSNAAIISKYLFYAGSGAIVGCGIGVVAGSVVFPTILWEAYKIMLHVTDEIVLRFNWWLCGIVVVAYTAVMLLVTWYCCRRALREEPAELIRPKAPDAGKKILLEHLPFWKKISFLNKVTIRNIFRYRQRLAMMMVGIGGCTALLVTGFGLRDSIVNVVDYQFEEVTTYDMSIYFADGQTSEQQEAFRSEIGRRVENLMFYHQSSMELDFDGKTKEIYFLAADPQVQDFIDFHSGEEPLAMPGVNEVLLTVGTAEAMGIEVGDKLQMRNADMQTLELTVSGIYDNHVYNYAIVMPQTIQAQWGTMPQMQMAFVKLNEAADTYALSAEIAKLPDVMNVSVSDDLAHMVRNMMDALDLVVWVIVFCAGLLAAIVLYNLTNININERIREIATIKVLGFNAGETAAYVFKENLSLTVIGAIAGLFLGDLLLIFVMSQIKIDIVWFKAIALPLTYLLSIVLTMLSAVIVDFVFYFKLEKINIAEALKSVE